MPVGGRLRRFPKGIGRPPAQMPQMQESETNRMRRRLTGASGKRISFERLFSLTVNSFQMRRARHATGLEGKLSPALVGRTVGVVGEELRLAAEKLPPGATRVRPIVGGRVPNVVSKFRWVSAICCCFGVLYFGEVSSESCALLLLMGKNLL